MYGIIKGYMDGCACMMDDVLNIINEKIFKEGKKVLFFGDGVDYYEEKIRRALSGKGTYTFAPESDRYQDAASVGFLAVDMINKGMTVSFDRLVPDYMRKAEAEQKLEAGELHI